jgi:hypothetical protein
MVISCGGANESDTHVMHLLMRKDVGKRLKKVWGLSPIWSESYPNFAEGELLRLRESVK